MGFGLPNFGQQNQQLLQQITGQINALNSQQAAQTQAQQAANSSILNQYAASAENALGHNPLQQYKAVNFGIMDFIKTGPRGLTSSSAPNSAGLSLLGK